MINYKKKLFGWFLNINISFHHYCILIMRNKLTITQTLGAVKNHPEYLKNKSVASPSVSDRVPIPPVKKSQAPTVKHSNKYPCCHTTPFKIDYTPFKIDYME